MAKSLEPVERRLMFLIKDLGDPGGNEELAGDPGKATSERRAGWEWALINLAFPRVTAEGAGGSFSLGMSVAAGNGRI